MIDDQWSESDREGARHELRLAGIVDALDEQVEAVLALAQAAVMTQRAAAELIGEHAADLRPVPRRSPLRARVRAWIRSALADVLTDLLDALGSPRPPS